MRESWEIETASLPGFKPFKGRYVRRRGEKRNGDVKTAVGPTFMFVWRVTVVIQNAACRSKGLLISAVRTIRLSLPMCLCPLRDGNIDSTLESGRQTIVLCHHGVRSMYASTYLIQQGFQNVHNVSGGIDAYSRQVDPRVPTY